jgi:hypothetical protein
MAVRGAVILFNSSAQFAQSFLPTQVISNFPAIATGSNVGPQVFWPGGRTMLVVSATTYPSGLTVQTMMPDGSWLSIGSSVVPIGINTNTYVPMDLAQGTFRVIATSGSSAGLNALLVGVQYGN